MGGTSRGKNVLDSRNVAKLFNKNGILIESTVSAKILLHKYKRMKNINNNYVSSYCKSPCGLTDLFNYNNEIGCYNTLKLNHLKVKNNNLFHFMGRRDVKNKYTMN